jgi:hypothetical protein
VKEKEQNNGQKSIKKQCICKKLPHFYCSIGSPAVSDPASETGIAIDYFYQ